MFANWKLWRASVRIVWAITAKDLLEAIKNKNTAFLIVFGLLMVVFYGQFPALVSQGESPNVLVYDAGESALVAFMENSEVFETYSYRTQAIMQEKLSHGDVPELGLVIPDDFDQRAAAGDTLEMQGYVMNWVSPEAAKHLQDTVARELSRLVGAPIEINLEGNIVYPTPESGGIGVTAGFGFIYIITTLGLILVPHLMLEEKQSHTLDALLISPASQRQVTLAKGLAGLFYCLVGAGLGLAVFHGLVVHWWLALLAVICGSLFTVAMGLILGTAIDNRGQLTMLAWIFILPLFLPVFLSLMDDLLPAALITVFRAIPTVVLFNLLRVSFAGDIPQYIVLLQLLWIIAWAAGGMLVVAWLLGRRDRAAEVSPGIHKPLFELVSTAFHGRLHTPPVLAAPRAFQHPSQTLPQHEESKPAARTAPSNTGLHIVFAIALKDISTAVRNKLVLSILLGTLLVVANGSVLPLLLGLRNTPTAVVYDEGHSTILRGMTARSDLRLSIVQSRDEMEQAVSGAPETRLGLVLPADFDQRAGSDTVVTLSGYVAHWANAEKAARYTEVFAQELSRGSWNNVKINLDQPALYPSVDTGGQLSITTLMMVIVILTIGMALVPLLFIEEKESQTYEVLLVSPASLGQVLAGKALAGGFYCLTASLVVLLLNQALLVHWGLALLAVVLGAAFTVALGLVVGLLTDSPSTTGVWGGILMVVLIALTILHSIAQPDWPSIVRILLERLPGAALIELFQLSMVGNFPPDLVWTNAAALVVAAGLVYALIYSLMRRADR